jgi:transcriptional regulator with XRE-family HTH domain
MVSNPKKVLTRDNTKSRDEDVGETSTNALLRGQSLKRAIHRGRIEASIRSDRALAKQAGVRYQTLMDWYAGRTRPTPATLSQIAVALQVKLGDLWAAWERLPEAAPGVGDPLVSALGDQTAAINRLVDRLDSLASGAIRDGVADALREAQRDPGGGGSRDERPSER